MPSAEQIPGIQSTKRTCTVEPFFGLCESAAASTRKKKPRANYVDGWRELVSCRLMGMRVTVRTSAPEEYTPDVRALALLSQAGFAKRKRRLSVSSMVGGGTWVCGGRQASRNEEPGIEVRFRLSKEIGISVVAYEPLQIITHVTRYTAIAALDVVCRAGSRNIQYPTHCSTTLIINAGKVYCIKQAPMV